MKLAEMFHTALKAVHEREREHADPEAIRVEAQRKANFDKDVDRKVDMITGLVLDSIRFSSPRFWEPDGSLRIVVLTTPNRGEGAAMLKALNARLEAEGVETEVINGGKQTTAIAELHVIVRPERALVE